MHYVVVVGVSQSAAEFLHVLVAMVVYLSMGVNVEWYGQAGQGSQRESDHLP